MKRSRRPFRGVLYAGLMVTSQGPKVLEYNVRFGDPECQPLLMRLKSDFVDLLEATVDGRLDEIAPLEWDPRPAVCVVMASEGYPGNYEKGQPIRGLDEAAQSARRQSLSRRHGNWRRPGRHRRRSRAGRDRTGHKHLGGQAAGVHGREMHPIQRRMVPQGHLGQGAKLSGKRRCEGARRKEDFIRLAGGFSVPLSNLVRHFPELCTPPSHFPRPPSPRVQHQHHHRAGDDQDQSGPKEGTDAGSTVRGWRWLNRVDHRRTAEHERHHEHWLAARVERQNDAQAPTAPNVAR